ncbi:MAG: homoserine kinase type II [Candidatus Azotimanducaceae bacterium]
MAAFTTFKKSALERYLRIYDIGELHSFDAISTGIENSNYFVKLTNDLDVTEFVLTITEELSFKDVPFFNDLMGRLIKKNLPVPNAQRTLDGMSSAIFCGKPTWLFNKLEGSHPVVINQAHCLVIGQSLAKLHHSASDAKYQRSNPYCSEWMLDALKKVEHRLDSADLTDIYTLANHYVEIEMNSKLPKGVIHGDLFTDNALFVGEELSGIIDFYHACNDFLVQDIAVTINDWCKTPSGNIDETLKQGLLEGYRSIRKLTKEEETYLPLFQQIAALRFSLTRMLSGPEEAPLKDPVEFLKILKIMMSAS